MTWDVSVAMRFENGDVMSWDVGPLEIIGEERDVRLAGAAPDLLAALDNIEERLSTEQKDEPMTFPSRCQQALDYARDAIAKATGTETTDG